jgi:muramoyltetrapeptide carboxypeptidase
VSASAPPRIARGQTLGIVAPAGPVRLESLRRGLDRLGGAFRLKLAPSLGGARVDGAPSYIAPPREPGVPSYLAASDDMRAAELNAMLADHDVRAILLARGGYGLMRILPRLDVAALRADPKPIVGFSDATALLAWAYAAGVRGIHGPMGVQMERLSDGDIAQLVALLTDPRAPGVRPWPLVAHGRGVYRGPLIAANLTMMSVLAGTPWALAIRGAIGLIEEVGERPYELDRYLTHLVLAGELSKIAAMIVGDLTRCEDASPPLGIPDPPDAALATVLERLHAAGTPAATGAPIGHGDRNEAVPFGATSVLDLDAGTLEITEGAVSA